MKIKLALFSIIVLLFDFNLFACSIVSVESSGNIFIGRNFDYYSDDGEICFFKKPSSYAHFTLHQLGEDMPYDGINEFGLFIGQTAVYSARADSSFSFLRKSTTSLGIMKKVLERAKNVDEAIRVFNQYNIWFGTILGFPKIHYLVADKKGNSAVIEYVDGSLVVYKKDKKKYQLITNFLLSEFPQEKALKEKLFYRYRLAIPFLEKSPISSIEDIRKVIRMVSQSDLLKPRIELIFRENKSYSFNEIRNIFLINQASQPKIVDPFKETGHYTPEEIERTLAGFLRENGKVPAHTIWSSIYSINANEINIEVYYRRDWNTPKRFNFRKIVDKMEGRKDCKELTHYFH